MLSIQKNEGSCSAAGGGGRQLVAMVGVSGITIGQQGPQCGPVGVSRPLTSVKLIENRNSAATRRAIPFQFGHTQQSRVGRGEGGDGRCLCMCVCVCVSYAI